MEFYSFLPYFFCIMIMAYIILIIIAKHQKVRKVPILLKLGVYLLPLFLFPVWFHEDPDAKAKIINTAIGLIAIILGFLWLHTCKKRQSLNDHHQL